MDISRLLMLTLSLALVSALSLPLGAQEQADEIAIVEDDGIWIGIPLYLSYQFDLGASFAESDDPDDLGGSYGTSEHRRGGGRGERGERGERGGERGERGERDERDGERGGDRHGGGYYRQYHAASFYERSALHVALQVFFPLGEVAFLGPEVGIAYPISSIVTAARTGSTIALAEFDIPLRLVLGFTLSDEVRMEFLGGTELRIGQIIRDEGINELFFDVGARLDLWGFLIDVSYAIPYNLSWASGGVESQFIGSGGAIQIGLGYRFRI